MDPQNEQPVEQPAQQPENNLVNNIPTQPQVAGKSLLKNKLFLIGVVLVIALVIAGVLWFLSTQQQRNYETALRNAQEAEDAYKRGDLKTTQDKLLISYKTNSKDPDTQAALIKAIALEGNLTGTEQQAFEKAAPYIEEALNTNGENVEVLLAVGYAHEIAGMYDQALEFYEKALSNEPDNAEGLFHKGHVLEFLGRQSEAFAEYKKAYSLNQNDPIIANAYAKTLFAEGKNEEASNVYKATANIVGISAIDKADSLINASVIKRANVLTVVEAIDLSAQAVEAAPNYSPALATHGFNLGIYEQKLAEGTDYLKKAIEANPRISQNYWRLSALYRLSNNFTEAEKLLEEALARVDDDNTLITANEKNNMKGSMLYDLAFTKTLINPNSDVLATLVEAMRLAPGLKPTLQKAYTEHNRFKNYENNPQFQELIR